MKPTYRQGSRNSRAKLTEADIPVIIGLVDLGYEQDLVSRWLGVDRSVTSRIVRGLSWAHVDLPEGLTRSTVSRAMARRLERARNRVSRLRIDLEAAEARLAGLEGRIHAERRREAEKRRRGT